MEYMNELSRQDIIEELRKALEIWSSNTQLRFTFLEKSELADIQISFHRGYHGDGYPFDGIGAVLAHAFFPGPGRGGDAHFDEDENWTNQGRSDGEITSLYAVALHEFGHSLGELLKLFSTSYLFSLIYNFKNLDVPFLRITFSYMLPEVLVY